MQKVGKATKEIPDGVRSPSQIAREQILDKIGKLRLNNYNDITDFLNKHRQYKADLQTAKHTYTDAQLVTNILIGLPRAYKDFKSHKPKTRRNFTTNNNGNDSHNNQNSGNGNRQRKHSIDKGKLQCAGCGKPGHEKPDCWHEHPEKAPKALREKLLKTKEEKSKSSPFLNNNSQSSTGSKPKELIAMADGTAFRTAMAQPNYDDRIAIVDTARVDVGHYFPFSSTEEREYAALFRCLTDHMARGDGVSRTYILTTRPDPSTWEQSNNREIRIAQEMVREAVNRGSIILKDREGHTLRDDPEPWGEKPENHMELYHLVKDMYGVHNAPTAFLRRVIEIGQALDNETQAATDTNNQSADTNNDQGHIEKGPTDDDSANNCSTGENPISNLSDRNSIANAPPQINSEGGQARYGGLGQRVCEGEDHYGQEAVLLDQKMMTCYIGSAKEITGEDTVLLDSGADICLFKDKKWFNTLRPLDVNIGSINGSASLKIKGGGNVRLILLAADGTETPITLTDVAYSPGARSNIVSLSQLATKGNLQGSWDKNQITILAEGRNVGQAIRVNGLYLLQLQKKTNIVAMADAFAGLVTYDDDVWTWHRRLGHLSLHNMIILLDISTGITVTKAAILKKIKSGEVCPVCAVTRATVKIPRDPATRREEEFGFLFHADTWGPYPIEGFDGTRYFLFVTDDAKRFTFAAPISVKANLPKIFKRLHKTIEKTYNIKIRGYRFDNEFWKGPIGRWLVEQNCRVEPTVAWQHYMGGTHERVNRVMREKAAPMIQELTITGQLSRIITEKALEYIRQSSLPANLWPEAVKYAIWHKNRAPSRALRRGYQNRTGGVDNSSSDDQAPKTKKGPITPWEALNRHKPDLSKDSIWGSRVYVTIPPETRDRGKLHQPRGWVGYFVGLESESVFRIFSPDKHEVFRVAGARVQQGQGLDDPHEGQEPIRQDTPQELARDEQTENQQTGNEQAEYDTNFWQEDVSEEGEQPQEEDNLELYQQDDVELYDDFPDDSPFVEPENPFPNPLPSNSPTSSDPMNNENDENTPPQRVTSRFFGSTLMLAKRQRTPSESEASSEISKTSSTDEDEPNKKRKKKKRSDHDNRTKWKKRMRFSKGKVCGKCLEDGGHCFFDEDTDPEWPEVRPACVRCKKLPGAPGNKCRVITDPEEIKACKAINAQRNKRGISLRSAGKRPKRIGVKKEFKCSRCAKRRLACDGKIPCETCTTKGIPCRKQDTEKDEKCTRCEGRHRRCDKETPCSDCVKEGTDCIRHAQQGLLTRVWPIGKRSTTLWIKMKDNAKCRPCWEFNSICDGLQPCGSCIKRRMRSEQISAQKKGKKLNNLRLCVYKNEEDGYFKK
ncbi:hypothetical protein CMEL01_02353 [Colletotrichum melonis]|uniref:Uncharacterized protein n=1 Tax=Colletotrichum melonis TaxID=1209925 RepID=A0AAI9XT94_9PEZI|nr:hypothetical protein CMEL01_02353 [Colletotrichum melonis]